MTHKKKRFHHPHDATFKNAMQNVQVGRELLKQHLPKELQAIIDWDTLTPTNASYIDEDLKQSASDILYQVRLRQGEVAYIYYLCEHMARPDYYMPLRLMEYLLRIGRAHLKKGHKRLPLVIPVVLFQGKRPYPASYPRDIIELCESPDLARRWMFKPFQLIDLANLDDETLMQTPWASLLQMVMKHIYDRDIEHTLRKLLEARVLQTLLDQNGENYVKTILYYVYNMAGINDKEQLVQMMNQTDPQLGALNMTIAEQWREEGLQQGVEKGMLLGKQEGIQLGKQEGMQLGKQEGIRDMALTMIRLGDTDHRIALITGLSLNDIAQLKNQIKD